MSQEICPVCKYIRLTWLTILWGITLQPSRMCWKRIRTGEYGQHWFLGAIFHNGSYVHSGRKKRQWWKRQGETRIFWHRHPPWLGRENIPPVSVPDSFVVFFFMSVKRHCNFTGPWWLNCIQIAMNWYAFTSSQYGRSPLHYASSNGHVEVVAKLIAANADINLKDKVRTSLPG